MSRKIPKVFISYSWDDEIHKEWVLKLATRLTENRVNVILDIWELSAGKDKDFFMEDSVKISDKVLMIMTPNYKIKAENRSGGVGNEISMIRAEKFNNQDTVKFIPIVRSGNRENCTPLFAKSLFDIDMSNVDNFENSFEELLLTIFNKPKNKKPSLGKKKLIGKAKLSIDSGGLDLMDESQLNNQNNIQKVFEFNSKSDWDEYYEIDEAIDRIPRLLKYSQKELLDILLNFENEGRKIVLLFGSVKSGQSMFLASMIFFAYRAKSKDWSVENPKNFPFNINNIFEMISLLDNHKVMDATQKGECDFIGIDIVPNNKNLPTLKLAFVHISGEFYNEILTHGKLNKQLELLLECSTFVKPIIFLITPYKPDYQDKKEDELHYSFINYLKENMPKLYQTSKICILISQWDKNTERIGKLVYLKLYRPLLFKLLRNEKLETYCVYSIGNIIKLIEEPFQYVTHINFEYPNRIWNYIYKYYTNKNFRYNRFFEILFDIQ